MSIPLSEQRMLKRIDKAVCRSDPRLAAMLATFAWLAAGEVMPARERLPHAARRARLALLLALTVIAGLALRGLRSAWHARPWRHRRAAAAGQAAANGPGRPR